MLTHGKDRQSKASDPIGPEAARAAREGRCRSPRGARQHDPARAPSAAPSAATPSSRRRWTSSPRAALPRPGSTTWRKRAGVAKGTIYLHFADKETLFQELIRLELSPVVGALEQRLARRHSAPAGDRPVDRGVRPRDFRDAPQGRHPACPHRRPALPQARRILLSRGDLARRWKRSAPCCAAPSSAASSRPTRWCVSRNCSPAPGIVAIIWSGLFDRFEPLDVRAMMRAHFDVLLGDRSAA